MYIANTLPNINADKRRAKLLQVGRLIHQRGVRQTAENLAECVTLEPAVRDETIRHPEDFTRLRPEFYKATTADQFVPFLVSGGGERR